MDIITLSKPAEEGGTADHVHVYTSVPREAPEHAYMVNAEVVDGGTTTRN